MNGSHKSSGIVFEVVRMIAITFGRRFNVPNMIPLQKLPILLSVCFVISFLVSNARASENADSILFGEFIHGSRKEVKDCDLNNSALFVFTKSQYFDLNFYEIKIVECKGDTVLMGIHTAYDGFYKNRKGKVDTIVVEMDFRSSLQRIHSQFQNYQQDRDSVLVMTPDGPRYHYSYCESIRKANDNTGSYYIDFGLIAGNAHSARAFSDSVNIILNEIKGEIPFLGFMKPRSIKATHGSGGLGSER